MKKTGLVAFCASLLVGAAPVSAQLVELYSYPLGPELLKDPSFESGELKPAWSCHASQTIDSSIAKDGAKSVRQAYDPAIHKYTPNCVQVVTLQPGEYAVGGWIKTEGVATLDANGDRKPDRPGGARIAFGPAGGSTAAVPTPPQSGTKDWTWHDIARHAVHTAGQYRVIANSYGAPDGTIWWDGMSLRPHDTPDAEMFLKYPNYLGRLLPGQPNRILVAVKRGKPSFTGAAKVLVRAPDGTVLASRDVELAEAWTDVEFPAPAQNEVRVSLEAAGANYTPVYVVKREAKLPATYFDAANWTHMPGKKGRRFIIGVYHTGGYSYNWAPMLDRVIGRMKIDLYLNYQLGCAPYPSLLALGRYLAGRGAAYVDTTNSLRTHYCKDPDGQNRLIVSPERVKALAGQPGIWGFYTMDERPTEKAIETFGWRKVLTDNGKVLMPSFIVSNAPSHLYAWRDIGDVVATDPYSIRKNNLDAATGLYKLGEVAKWTDMTLAATLGARPAWQVMQLWGGSGFVYPTREQLRAMCWLAITKGARGLFFWSLGMRGLAWLPPDRRAGALEDLRVVIDEIKSEEHGLTGDDVPLPEPMPAGLNCIARTREKIHVYCANETVAPITHGTRTWAPHAMVSWTAERNP